MNSLWLSFCSLYSICWLLTHKFLINPWIPNGFALLRKNWTISQKFQSVKSPWKGREKPVKRPWKTREKPPKTYAWISIVFDGFLVVFSLVFTEIFGLVGRFKQHWVWNWLITWLKAPFWSVRMGGHEIRNTKSKRKGRSCSQGCVRIPIAKKIGGTW